MRRIFLLSTVCAFIIAAAAALPASAALTVSFNRITANNSGNADIGNHLFLNISNAGADQFLFTFRNTASFFPKSSISEIYFDSDKVLSGLNQIYDQTGVKFSSGAKPADLPGGQSISPIFVATSVLSISANNPSPSNGINPGESLSVLYNLAGPNYDSLVTALINRELRIGLHVQGLANGSSESFINNLPPPLPDPPAASSPPTIPAPAALILASIGAGFVSFLRRRNFI